MLVRGSIVDSGSHDLIVWTVYVSDRPVVTPRSLDEAYVGNSIGTVRSYRESHTVNPMSGDAMHLAEDTGVGAIWPRHSLRRNVERWLGVPNPLVKCGMWISWANACVKCEARKFNVLPTRHNHRWKYRIFPFEESGEF